MDGYTTRQGWDPLITDPPPTNSNNMLERFFTWHGTSDIWHVTCDMWHRGGGEHFLNISGRDLEQKGYWMNELISAEAVCRATPATPGLLIIQTITWVCKVAQAQIILALLIVFVFQNRLDSPVDNPTPTSWRTQFCQE